jgi:NAD+ synthase (glutamine-hydrolysing)
MPAVSEDLSRHALQIFLKTWINPQYVILRAKWKRSMSAMRTLRLAMAQVNPIVGDLEGNSRKILDVLGQARSLEVDLVAFPEMVLTGYPPEDLVYKPQFIQDNLRAMKNVASQSHGLTVVLGLVDSKTEKHKAAAIASDGQLVGIYHKMFLPNYGVFDELRYFTPGDSCPVFVVKGIVVGVNICEDIWYPLGPTTVQREAGAEIIVNINGSPYYAGKQIFREKMLATRASDNGLYVSYTNMVGGQDELVFDGGSAIFSPTGELIAQGSQFTEDLIVVDIDADEVSPDPPFRKEDPKVLKQIGKSKRITISNQPQSESKRPLKKQNPTLYEPLAEIYTALVTGTRDYVKKNGFTKVLIGMSGGIDSTLVACIATEALGKENVVGVTMPSRYSSEGSVLDSQKVAENLQIPLFVIPIENTFETFLNTLESHFQDATPGVAEENLQARIRGTLLMALSNKFGWLVLTTGNKSELAMGYATLYGDMAGGYGVIKDVLKTLVYSLAEWLNQVNLNPIIPANVILKPPSAELRPDQTDQDTLPPYEILDPILKAYIEEDRGYTDLVNSGYDHDIIQQVISLVDKNEYKRRQAAPGVKITPRAFGKDRRLPIVNRYRQF